MPGTPTPILGFIIPTVGGDNNIWGGELNANFALADGLGACANVNFSVDTVATAGVFPEKVYRGTTGAGTIALTLPPPATCPGKIFTAKKVDAGLGTLSVVGAIDGQVSWDMNNQFQYVRVQSNGASYDVIGNN